MEFLKDLTVQILGNLIALAGAVYLYLREIRDERKKEDQEIIDNDTARLLFLRANIREAVVLVDEQVEAVKNCIKSMDARPLIPQAINILPHEFINDMTLRFNKDALILAYHKRVIAPSNSIFVILRLLDGIRRNIEILSGTFDLAQRDILKCHKRVIKIKRGLITELKQLSSLLEIGNNEPAIFNDVIFSQLVREDAAYDKQADFSIFVSIIDSLEPDLVTDFARVNKAYSLAIQGRESLNTAKQRTKITAQIYKSTVVALLAMKKSLEDWSADLNRFIEL